MDIDNNGWASQLALIALPETLNYEHAIWGKAHGAASDFRWLARSVGFTPDDGLERNKLSLGAQDHPCDLYFWRYLPNSQRYYLGKAYCSRATDAAGRSGFLEKQILEWANTPNIPAALAALLLFMPVKQWQDEIWWHQRDQIDWSDDTSVLSINTTPINNPHNVVKKILEPVIHTGLQELKANAEQLIHCYARLLAQEKPAALYAPKALQAETLATLLLPLEQELANRLSIAGWIPSNYHDIHKLGENWDIIVLPQRLTTELSPAATKQLPKAQRMVDALLKNQPSLLNDPTPQQPQPSADNNPQQKLAMWGASSAGKTFLLAQLHLTIGADSAWDIYPADGISPEFIEAMRNSLSNNFFPAATAAGYSKEISYEFINRNNPAPPVVLSVEDRAGSDHISLHEESMQRMKAANGLVLLFDPMGDHNKQHNALSQLFERMVIERRGQNRPDRKDPRPIVVCISKADTLIADINDYIHACTNPDAFIRNNRKWSELKKLLDKYCANYYFYPVSAVGITAHYGVIETNTFFDEQLRVRVKNQLQPFNLIEPFVWLINQLEDGYHG